MARKKKRLSVYTPLIKGRKSRVLEYMTDYVQRGLSVQQIAVKYGVSENVLEKHRGKGKWVLARQLYMEDNGLTMQDLLVIARNDERAESWKKYGEIVMMAMDKAYKELSSRDARLDEVARTLSTLGNSLDRAFKGERLERGQATEIQKVKETGKKVVVPKLLNIMLEEGKGEVTKEEGENGR